MLGISLIVSPLYFLRHSLSLGLESTHQLASSSELWGPPCVSLALQALSAVPSSLWECCRSGLGSNFCTASTSLTEPLPLPQESFLIRRGGEA